MKRNLIVLLIILFWVRADFMRVKNKEYYM